MERIEELVEQLNTEIERLHSESIRAVLSLDTVYLEKFTVKQVNIKLFKWINEKSFTDE